MDGIFIPASEKPAQKLSDHARFGLHFMSWVPSVRFQPGAIGNVGLSRSI
jgi:hypothetical protein